MNHTTLTLLTCAALAAPSTVLAEETQEDPRAQVTEGFGPQTRRIHLVPPPDQAQAQAQVDPGVPLYFSTLMVSGGIVLGTVTGFTIAGATDACQESPTDPFARVGSAVGCFAGMTRSLLMGMTGGLVGALVGGLASDAVYHALQAQLRVTPVVTGSGAAGVSLSGSF